VLSVPEGGVQGKESGMKVRVVTEDEEHVFEGDKVEWVWENPHITIWVDGRAEAAFASAFVRYVKVEMSPSPQPNG